MISVELKKNVEEFFGMKGNYIEISCDKGYRDVQRTLAGIGQFLEEKETARAVIIAALEVVSNNEVDINNYDSWHKDRMDDIKKCFADCDFNVTYGHAQKWLNMAFKYLFGFYVLADKNVDCFIPCHLPVDSIIREKLSERFNITVPKTPWSKEDDYSAYIDYQNEVRKNLKKDETPLILDYMYWQQR